MELMYMCGDTKERDITLNGFAPRYAKHLRDNVLCEKSRHKGMRGKRAGIKARIRQWERDGKPLLTLSGERADPQPAQRDIRREAQRIITAAVNRWKAEVHEGAKTSPRNRTDVDARNDRQRWKTAFGTWAPEKMDAEHRRRVRAILERQGQPQFREVLLEAYGGRCAITGCDAKQALDAAHIVPYESRASNHPANGLLLRTDVHRLFDLYLIAVDTTDMTVRIAESIADTEYGDLQGARVRIPEDAGLRPDRQALDKHRSDARL